MEKLIQKYNEECSFISKWSYRFWLVGEIISIATVGIVYMNYNKIIGPLIVFIIFVAGLMYLCDYIELKDICCKLKIEINIKKIIFNRKRKKQIYEEMNKYQKNWMTCYCKKYKLNTINKLKIIKDEINKKNSEGIVKYVDPVIIGTLLLVVWEKIISSIFSELKTENIVDIVTITIILSIIISLIIGWWKRKYKQQCELVKMYSKYFGYDRLNELLVYEMLKCKK